MSRQNPTPPIQEKISAQVNINPHDQKFMDKLTNILEHELANPDLNINTLSKDLGFSRTGFYRKVKELTGMPPINYLQSYRSEQAARLIRKGSLSLAEIADQIGFNSYSYFSRSFKKHFGVNPKEYSSKHNNRSE